LPERFLLKDGRKMRTGISIFLAVSIALCGMSQEPPGFIISDNVDLVLLDVNVKDAHGSYAADLKRDNFQVFDNGEPRPITHFSSFDTPVTIGLVVDNSGSMRAKRPEVISSGLAFAKESNPQDEFFVVNFNNTVALGLLAGMPFTDDLQTLRAALYYGEPAGQTALYDAVAYALKHLELSHKDKRTLIVVSDGGDNVSITKYPELLRLLQSSRTTVYTVGLYDPEDQNKHLAVLKKLSSVSGGKFFQPATLADIPAVFSGIAKDIRNCYTLGFSPGSYNPDRTIHRVKVTVQDNHRKLVVRTRTTYSMQPFTQGQAGEGTRRR
jgi:Ca-activated chloride channel homolog